MAATATAGLWQKGDAGRISLAPTAADAAELEDIVRSTVDKGFADVPGILRERLPLPATRWKYLPLVIFSDCEPDDQMAIAQEWQLFAQVLGKDPKAYRPLLIFKANFVDKDTGTVFQKKLLMLRLFLGLQPDEVFVVCGAEDNGEDEKTHAVHPHHAGVYGQRADTFSQVAQALAKLATESGDAGVDVALISPGKGVLGEILSTLREQQSEGYARLQGHCRCRMYTGGFNTRNSSESDWAELKAFLGERSQVEPLVDMSKFGFFGGQDALPCTESIGTFEKASVSEWINAKWPKLSAAWMSFALEFNADLIAPTNTKLFTKLDEAGKPKFLPFDEVLEGEELARYQAMVAILESQGCQAYCAALLHDEPIYKQVTKFKQGTVRALANRQADGPLCDQLCFLWDYLRLTRGEEAAEILDKGPTGMWTINKERGFSGVRTGGDANPELDMGIQALQPKLRNPRDEATLLMLSDVLEEYLLRHLEQVRAMGV